jgi:hypothetical protein
MKGRCLKNLSMMRWKVWAALRSPKDKEVLEQAKRGYNHRFCYVLWRHRYLMVTLDEVDAGDELAAM